MILASAAMRPLLLITNYNLDVTFYLSYIEKCKTLGTKSQIKGALFRWDHFIATKGYNEK